MSGIEIRKVTAHIGARVLGVDISKPLDEEHRRRPARRPSTSTRRWSSTTSTWTTRASRPSPATSATLTTAHPTVPAVDGAPNVLPVDSERGRRQPLAHRRHLRPQPAAGQHPAQHHRPAVRRRDADRQLRGRLPRPARTAARARRHAVGRAHQRLRLRGAGRGARRGTGRAARPVHVHQVPHRAPGRPGAPADRRTRPVHRRVRAADRRAVGRRVPQDPRPAPGVRHPARRTSCAGAGRRTSSSCSTTASPSTTPIDNYDDLPRRLHRVTVAGDVPVGIEGKESYSIDGRRLALHVGRRVTPSRLM